MSIWGKVLGGAAGFALGGPLGAFIGALAGHAFDKRRERRGAMVDEPTKRVAFTIAIIVLGAKMAKADGIVTRDEIRAFRQVFHIPPEEMGGVSRVFDQARQEAAGFEPYAQQIARMFADRPAVLEKLLGALIHIAKADGVVSSGERDYLKAVAGIFGFDERAFERIRAEQMGPDQADPYEVLGVPREASDRELKAAYRRLIRENHPDSLIAQGMPQEFIDLANEKMATINAAHERIRKERRPA